MSTQFEKNSSSSSKRERLITSRLTPFEKLPRIGNSHEYIPRPPPSIHLNSTRNPRQKFFEKQQPILIAIKLSDGRRLQREFSPQNTILDIIKFIKSQQMDIENDFYLSSGDVPKRQFTDLNLTLLQANISNRTVLFIDRF